MKFMDSDHKQFYEQKLKELEKYSTVDTYHKSLIYTLGICDTTRKNFNDIFDMEKDMIISESLTEAYQTSSSLKVTRLAFNLFNSCVYDNSYDFVNNRVSKYYTVDEIFACSYAPYFYQAICIRYPSYTKKERKI